MAYFIVIGTDNNFQTVVDEIRKSHLQHNVVTSGCVVSKEDGNMYYHWDVYNVKGEKEKEGEKPSVTLKDALTNQIAQFNTLLPLGATTNVFLVGSCYTEEDVKRMKFVYDSLCEIGGATLNQIYIDIALLGYHLDNPGDVAQRPNWKILKELQGIENGKFYTEILYLNNIDYDGAATNVDARLLGRFLSHWGKILCSGGVNPKQTVKSNHYAIGLAERQYNFDDLAPFFKMAAEERILDRALHDNPSLATQQMLEKKYYSFIDLNKPWIDGLCSIKNEWESYCSYQFDYSSDISVQPYSLAVQQQQLSLYLNSWLKLYCGQQDHEIKELNARKEIIEAEISELKLRLDENLVVDTDTGEKTKSNEYKILEEKIAEKKNEKESCLRKINVHRDNIKKNTFADSRLIREDLTTELLTNSQNELYERHKQSERELFEYLHTDLAVDAIYMALEWTIEENADLPECPRDVFDNVGRLKALVPKTEPITETAPLGISDSLQPSQSERGGCIGWFVKLFHKNDSNSEQKEENVQIVHDTVQQVVIDKKALQSQINSAIKEFRRIKDVQTWWSTLINMVEGKSNRQKQCLVDMDGCIDNEGTIHAKRIGGYSVPYHKKSVSLIDVEMVRKYRDSDDYYLRQISELKERYFDSTIKDVERQSMQQLIKHQVIDALRGIWHTLHWDGKNPFCNESFTPSDIHDFIEDGEDGTNRQSKPFVEYVGLETRNITASINYLFYFSHPQIEREPNAFRNKYQVGQSTLTPIYLPDLTNSLCEVQVLDLTDYVDNVADFKPRTETYLYDSKINYANYVHQIVGLANSAEEKAKAIYDWLCKNIAYDTTYQIHDADRCWQTKRGVCQAYCELFVHLAKHVGVTAEIISGKSKDSQGNISDEDHVWIFVYTHGYEGLFIDPTWGAGHVKDAIFTASPTDMWFDVSPYWLIYSHYPDEQDWTKLDIDITKEQFEKLPNINPSMENDGKNILFRHLAEIGKS